MTPETDFLTANAQSTGDMYALVAKLTEADLTRDAGEGWTVAAMLAHIAFYDYRAVALIDRWQSSGVVLVSPLDADLINAANQPLLLTIPPMRAAALALEAAEAADQRVAAIDADFLDRIVAAGLPAATLHRSAHRRSHIEHILTALRG